MVVTVRDHDVGEDLVGFLQLSGIAAEHDTEGSSVSESVYGEGTHPKRAARCPYVTTDPVP